MTRVQQILFELETDYAGHPYYVTGNALYNAFARRVDATTRGALSVSHGRFVPGDHGGFPAEHSQIGGGVYLGSRLHPVKAYQDLFLFRHPDQRWLSDSRPRAAINTFGLRTHAGRVTVDPKTRFALPESAGMSRTSTTWHLEVQVHLDDEQSGAEFPLDESTLDGIRVGGSRNYGFGHLAYDDSQVIDLDALSYERIREANALAIELVSPYVLASGLPAGEDQSVPWWWDVEGDLRRREEQLIVDNKVHEVSVIDHGQVVRYAGDRPVETAKNGLTRVGTHSKTRLWRVPTPTRCGHHHSPDRRC
jgi:hypothetical protein